MRRINRKNNKFPLNVSKNHSYNNQTTYIGGGSIILPNKLHEKISNVFPNYKKINFKQQNGTTNAVDIFS